MSVNSAVKIREAVENRPAISLLGLQQRLFSFWFDGLVYNQIWEDPRVDLLALNLDVSSRLLTISSGGCNLLNYLTAKPHSIHAVDLNFSHICFTRLKLAAVKYLPTFEDYFHFYGYANRSENIDLYHRYIQSQLDENTRQYWESTSIFRNPRIQYFSDNLYNHGTMSFFIGLVNRLSKWFARDPKELLEQNDSKERERFFDENFAPFFERWPIKLLGKMPFLFYGLGIPPQQFMAMKKECDGALNRLYYHRIRRLACDFPIEENYFAWQAFGRRYDTEKRRAIPDYLKEEHYETIRSNVDRIDLTYTSLTDYLKQQPNRCLNRFVFLDSQDWMNEDTITELWREVARTGMPGSRIIFRTASDVSPVEFSLPADLRQRFVYEETRSRELFKQDRSAIYGGFHLYVLTK